MCVSVFECVIVCVCVCVYVCVCVNVNAYVFKRVFVCIVCVYVIESVFL